MFGRSVQLVRRSQAGISLLDKWFYLFQVLKRLDVDFEITGSPVTYVAHVTSVSFNAVFVGVEVQVESQTILARFKREKVLDALECDVKLKVLALNIVAK